MIRKNLIWKTIELFNHQTSLIQISCENFLLKSPPERNSNENHFSNWQEKETSSPYTKREPKQQIRNHELNTKNRKDWQDTETSFTTHKKKTKTTIQKYQITESFFNLQSHSHPSPTTTIKTSSHTTRNAKRKRTHSKQKSIKHKFKMKEKKLIKVENDPT